MFHAGMQFGGFPNVKLLSRYVTIRSTRGESLAEGWRGRVVFKAAADAVGKAVTLIITVVAARRLNADPFGILAYAMATGWLLGVATDAGLSMHLARETARDRNHSRQLLFEVISLRTGLAFLAATLVALLTPHLVPGHWRMQFVVIVLAQLAGAVTETIAHYFRGLQRSEIESTIHSAYRVVMLVWAMVALFGWRRLDYLGVAMLVPALVAMIVSMIVAARLSSGDGITTGQPPRLTPERLLRDVLPLGAGVLISALYFRCDVYFIQEWHGFQPVGGYNAAFRLVEALRLLPAAVMAVTFPALVQTTNTQMVRRIGTGLTVVGSALAIACAFGAPFIIPAIYGESYAYTAPAFSILALALPLFFLNYALTHQVIGWDGQRAYLLIATLALIANVMANFAFVPGQGIVGAAIATVLTEMVVTAGCVYVLVQHDRSPRGFLTKVPHEGSPRWFLTEVPHEGSSRGFSTGVPHEGSARSFSTEVPHGGSSAHHRAEPPSGTTVENLRPEPSSGTAVQNPRSEPPFETTVQNRRAESASGTPVENHRAELLSGPPVENLRPEPSSGTPVRNLRSEPLL